MHPDVRRFARLINADKVFGTHSIKTVLIPEENAKDLVEIADSIKSGLEIVPVSRIDEVLARAMTRKPEPIEWDETTTTATAVPEEAPVEEEASTLTAH